LHDCGDIAVQWVKWLATRENRLNLWGADASRRYIVEPLNLHEPAIVLRV
jgi:hypothetical protein